MIATTLGVLVVAEPALQRLAAERLPVATSYRLAKLWAAVTAETRLFYEHRNALVREYGEAVPEGAADDRRVVPSSPAWAAFVARAEELAHVPVEVGLDPLDLAPVDGLAISAADLLALGPLVTVNGGTP